MDVELDVRAAALDRHRAVGIHHLARVARTIRYAWTLHFAGVAHDFANPYYAAFYVVGILAASFHLGNGLFNFCCKWGIAVTPRAQRAAGLFGALVGVIFSVAGLLIVAGFIYNWHPFNGYL